MTRNFLGRAATIVLLLSSAALSARAADDPYASLKPLIGSWIVDRDCGGVKDRFITVFRRLPKTMVAEFRAAHNPDLSMGRADIAATGEEDHYRVATALPNNPVLAALGVQAIGGTLVVSTDEDENDLPNNYITCSSQVSALRATVAIKLRGNYRKGTFIFTTESPLGKQTCRGSGSKQPAAKK